MKKGRQSYILENPPCVMGTSTLVGKREHEGQLSEFFDEVLDDDLFGMKSYELAECKMQRHTLKRLLDKTEEKEENIDCIIGGDLQNQIFASCFAAREFNASFFGLYGACSTFGEGLIIASFLLNTENFNKIIVTASSHFSSAERNYRFPLELGNQRTPLSQWTVTGSGSVLLQKDGKGERIPRITAVTAGKVVDFGVTDANDMGAAMAPAAADTLRAHFTETGRNPNYYDAIYTGDLGIFGLETAAYLLEKGGISMPKTFNDCGKSMFTEKQKTFMGGSGAGCSAVVFGAYLYRQMKEGKLNKVLLVPTGALLNKDSPLQKQTIPAIAHAVAIEV